MRPVHVSFTRRNTSSNKVALQSIWALIPERNQESEASYADLRNRVAYRATPSTHVVLLDARTSGHASGSAAGRGRHDQYRQPHRRANLSRGGDGRLHRLGSASG